MLSFDENEKVVKVARRHWLAFVIEIILSVIAIIIPYLIYHFGNPRVLASFSWIFGNPNVFFVCYLLLVQVVLTLFFMALSDHYLDVWIITDGRIIDVEQKGAFSHEIRTLRYDLLSEITVEQSTALSRMFLYGNVHIKRSDGPETFSLLDVYHPEKIKEIILAEQKEYLNRIASVVRQQAGM